MTNDGGQGPTGFKWGPAVSTSYHRDIRPTISNPPSTKEFYNLQNVRVPWLTDGQVTEVRVTLRNSGETPMKRYRLADYIGASRDFQQPGDFYLSYNGQPKYRVTPTVANVVVGDKDDPFNPATGDRTENPNSTNDDRGAAWRMDLGDNRTGQLRAGDLNPGEYLTFSYYVRADRNWTLRATQGNDPSNDPQGNYNRRQQVGNNPDESTPNQYTEGGAIDTSYAHVYAGYVEDYCNPAEPMIGHVLEFRPGDVLAPWLRTQRGSVHSNRNIEGYDGLPGANNATFVVTANGVLNHFSSPDAFEDYNTGSQVRTGNCGPDTPPDGIDWRREMIKNTNALFTGRKNDSPGHINQLTGNTPQRGDLNGPQGNVWVVGSPSARANLDLNFVTQWRGVGTVVVYGDLNVNANQTYADSSGVVNSVGFIVMGNVRVNSSVTQMVGTYYISDVNFQAPGPVNAANCPVIAPGMGTFVSATDGTTANQQLNVNGLIVARTFEFGRYFVNGSDAVLDPAENVYYDGRVISSTPPGFGTFRNTSAWYEIAP